MKFGELPTLSALYCYSPLGVERKMIVCNKFVPKIRRRRRRERRMIIEEDYEQLWASLLLAQVG